MSNHDIQIARLEAQIDELKARLPKHSVPPAMILDLEELEDELKRMKAQGNSEPEGPLDQDPTPDIAL